MLNVDTKSLFFTLVQFRCLKNSQVYTQINILDSGNSCVKVYF